MSDILSQAEIDELLNALKSGTDEAADAPKSDTQNVRVYDFRTANRFTKDQMRSLSMVMQSYAQLLANQVTNVLRVACDCEVLSVEEMGYNEFNNSLPSPVILAVFAANPLAGTQLMQVSPEVAYMVINRLLGGVSSSKESSKQFTEIEMALIERFLGKIMNTFDEAWEKVMTVRTRLERLETNTQFVQITGLNEAVAVGTLSLRIGEDEGLISLCLPRAAIEPVANQLTMRSIYTAASTVTGERDEQQLQVLGDKIGHAKVDVVAYFKDTPATVIDIVNLQIGDVIRLDHKTSEPLLMKIQHIPKFECKVGTSKSQYALQIVDIIEETGEDESFAG